MRILPFLPTRKSVEQVGGRILMVEQEDALEIIGRIYDAALDAERWPELLVRIADFCGGANAALVNADPDIHFSSVITPRADPNCVSAYNRHWWKYDPISVLAAKAPPGKFVSVADIDREDYFSSAFYNEFRRFTGYGNYGVTVTLFRDRNAFGNFVLQTSPRNDEINAQTLRNTEIVVPHLARAASIARRLHRLELERSLTECGPGPDQAGLILVDAKGQQIFADDKAENLLAAEDRIKVMNGVIGLQDFKSDIRLKSAIQACAHVTANTPCGGSVRVDHEHDKPPLTIEVLPYRVNRSNPYGTPPVAMLLIRDPGLGRTAGAQKLRDRFGLTRAEATLAMEMLKGDGRAAAAKRCGITINTARTHLMRIFEKTGVRRQAELIRLLMNNRY
jgi:DNA-binding CsgD family transcriptional regulator